MPTPQGKYWCWTLNNPTEEDIENLQVLQILHPQSRVPLFSTRRRREQDASSTGVYRIQHSVTLKQAKLIVSNVAISNAEKVPRRSSQSLLYQRGWAPRRTVGVRRLYRSTRVRGRRTDLEAIRSALKAGTPEREIADAYFSQWLQYNVSFRRYRGLCFNHRDWKTKTIVIVGPPGTGNQSTLWTTIRPRTGSSALNGGISTRDTTQSS